MFASRLSLYSLKGCMVMISLVMAMSARVVFTQTTAPTFPNTSNAPATSNAPNAPTAPNAPNAPTIPNGVAPTAPQIPPAAGTVPATPPANITAGMNPECSKTAQSVLLPFSNDEACPVTLLFSGRTSTTADLSNIVPKICSADCIRKVKAAINSAETPSCKNDPVFAMLAVSAFYQVNYYCMKNNNNFCVIEQSAALDKANLPQTTPASAWSKDILCTDCLANQIAFSNNENISEVANLSGNLTKSARTNPSTDVPAIRKVCGDAFYTSAMQRTPSIILDLNGNSTSPNTGAKKGSATTHSAHTIGSAAVAFLVFGFAFFI